MEAGSQSVVSNACPEPAVDYSAISAPTSCTASGEHTDIAESA